MTRPQKKLFLLDALALIYRAHFAFNKNPRITSRGLNTSSIFGFMNSLMEVLNKEKPTHIGVAFDTAKATFRHEQFPMYKATRQSQPEDISIAKPYIRQIIEAMQIPILQLDGFEADDVIGTLAKKAALAGFEVYMMTPDKDYGQLVEEHIHIYKPAFMGKPAEKLGVAEVLDRWQIERIEQVTDMLGLVGDSVDNIPGIPGIGEKTAQKLIADYGSVENLIANAEQLKGKLKENVINYGQQGMLSKHLATIHLDVPIAFDEEALLHTEYDKPRLAALLDELEFRQMKTRLLGSDFEGGARSEGAAATAPDRSKSSTSGQMGLFDSPAFMPMPAESRTDVTPSGADDLPFDFGSNDTPATPAAKPAPKRSKATPVKAPTASATSATPDAVKDTITTDDAVGNEVTETAQANRPAYLDVYPDVEIDDVQPERRKTILSVKHDYRLVDTPELRESLVHFMSKQEAICFDSETTALDPVEADLVGLAFSYRTGEAFYVPVPDDPAEAQAIVDVFKPVLENPNIGKIGQNLKYDLLMLKKYGVEVQGKLFDTMIAHYLIEPEQRHNMDIMAMTYLNYHPVEIESLIGKKGKGQLNMRDVDVQKVVEYAGEDADVTLQLKETFAPRLEQDKLDKLFDQVEMPLVQVLADLELEGIRIDTNALAELSATLETDMRQVQQEIFEIAGGAFNIGSPKQLGEILFDKLKLDKNAKKTRTGQYATGEEILSKLEEEHEIARKILDYRELVKLKNTYVDALPLLISKRDGRIHTSFNQAVASTGRLSSANPNLQNIPIRTPRGQEIRKAFVPRSEEFLIMSADYSQIELRIMAAFSGDQTMLDAFNNGIDIHTQTASKVFHVPISEVTSDMRRKAKTINFGIIYGISSFGLAQRLKIPRKEASQIIEEYFVEFSAVKAYMDQSIDKARGCGYAETILGRRRYLRDINSRNITDRMFAERNAINAPIQGSAADMLKIAMIRIHEFLRKERLKSKMILTVHDELVFDAHRDELDILRENVNHIMKTAIPMAVQMETGIGVGENWLVAH
ncbi:DNA polymerase I [Fibrisoma limi BUZ 3]|uniref:DNA polymerase I n=1 Tax=Fibrisoma limi BUZ 3 TaxID=1185876 RepID=I2GFJ5_9BACT|nr:DNA polymerase I [Fibrisoma limi]CCH52670.1 DNA polymerase I [Fibrisoma limi BUZ 3]